MKYIYFQWIRLLKNKIAAELRFIYMVVFWYLQISSYNERQHFDAGWMYVPVVLYVIFAILYPLFIAVHLKIGKPGKRYYYSFIRFF